MAQTGYTPIALYLSTTASAAPSAGNLVAGELAINTLDEKLYFKNSSGAVKVLANSAIAGIIPGTGVATALAVNVGSAGAFVVNGGALGTPSSGTVTNLTGTASININGTVGATTPAAGAFTTLSATGVFTGKAGTAASPALTFATDTSSGLYQDTGSVVRVSVAGTRVAGFVSTGLQCLAGITAATGPSLSIDAGGTTGLFNPSSGVLGIASNGSEVGRFSSTGLAVTGSLSATGILKWNGYSTHVDDFGAWANAVDGTTVSALTGYPITFRIANSEKMRLDASGNLGLGVTPYAWSGAITRGFDALTNFAISASGALYGVANAYYNGTNWIYKNTAAASYNIQSAGAHTWYNAPSGTAGTAISFTQSLAFSKGTTLALEGASTVAGTGISFPATQLASSDANTLDDYREFTYTATATGMTTSPTGTVTCVRVGNMVSMEIPTITGTSNATSFTLTGGPTTMRPSSARRVVVQVNDNGGNIVYGMADIGTGGVVTLYLTPQGVLFTSSGTKGIYSSSFSYPI